jgi:uncharacterized protein (TIGR02391 family)
MSNSVETDYDRAVEFQDSLISVVENGDIGEDYYKEERDFFLKNYKDYVPSFLFKCRTVKLFNNQLMKVAYGSGSWALRRSFISDEFEKLLEFLEFGEVKRTSSPLMSSQHKLSLELIGEFSHVQNLLDSKHYFNAVEEAYKVVREKLQSITGKEKATEAFDKKNYTKIFGKEPITESEENFCEGVKFLHMAIQRFRNEKAHTKAEVMDKDLALHFITLAKLSYKLIDN